MEVRTDGRPSGWGVAQSRPGQPTLSARSRRRQGLAAQWQDLSHHEGQPRAQRQNSGRGLWNAIFCVVCQFKASGHSKSEEQMLDSILCSLFSFSR